MPIYIFELDGVYKEVVQTMKEPHVFIDENGRSWSRVFVSPQAAQNTKCDPFSSKDFVNKSASKKGNIGNLFDAAKEASIKREEKAGVDRIKEQSFLDYSKKRRGMLHPEQKKKLSRERLKKVGIEITD